jgi:tRNA threonylcarbamoyladenosine biosynthesis protein TsaE
MNIFDRLRAGVVTASAEESQNVAAEFAAALPATCTLALHGDLGVGKTTFVQGLARGFGLVGPVTSPTFNIYTLHQNSSRTLVHLDAYRLETAAQIDSLLIEEFLRPPWCLAVEWPEKVAAWLPADALHLDLGITADEHHTIRLR